MLRVIGFLLCVGITIGSCKVARTQEPLPDDLGSLDRIRREYAQALEQVEDFYAHLKGKGSKISDFYGGTHTESSFEFAQSGDWLFVARTVDSKGARTAHAESVWARNSRYQFELLRFSHNDAYSLRDFQSPPNSNIRSNYGSYNNECGKFLTASHNLMETPMSVFLADPNFVFTEASQIKYNGKKMLKISFRCDGRVKVFPTLYSGWIIVNPEEHYAIHQWEAFRAKKMVPSRCNIEYAETPGDVPVPRRVFVEHTGDSAAAKHEVVFDEILHESLPESRFRLAAFGLPEIGSQSPSRRGGSASAGYLMFGLALVALSIALILRYLSKRSGRNSAS